MTATAPAMWTNPLTAIRVVVEVSTDGGATWTFIAGLTAIGGVHLLKDGTESPATILFCRLQAGSNRTVRCVVSVANGPFVSNLTLEAL